MTTIDNSALLQPGDAAKDKAKKAAKPQPQDYWSIVRREFFKRRLAVFGLIVIVGFFLIALLAPLLANDKPIVASYKGKLYFPAFTTYLDSDAYPVTDTGSRWLRRVWPWPKLAPVYPELDDRTWKEAIGQDWQGGEYEPALWTSGETGWALWPLIPHGFNENRPEQGKKKPGDPAIAGKRHYFGTDVLGRDVLARMIYGTIVAMSVGVLSVGIYCTIGIILGALAGFFGGWVDVLLSRVIEIVMCFPTLFLILAVVTIIDPSIYPIIIMLGLIRWTGPARLIRGEFLKARGSDYVMAATSLGLPPKRVIFRHMVPNCLSPVLVTAAFGVAGAILIESSLSFLGFGVAPPMASWGEIASQGRKHISEGLWHLILFPGIATFVTVTCFNLMGEGLRDAMDPKLRS